MRTFDSSATPRPGQARPAARRMAPVDLAALGEQIMATVERAKAEDPKALRAAIAGLQAQLDARPAPAPPERIEVPVIDSETLRQLDNARQAWESSTAQLQALLAAIDTKLAGARAAAASTPATPIRKPTAPPPITKSAPPTPVSDQNGNGSSLPKAQRAVLSVLAQHGPRSTTQVAVLTGYSSKSGGFRNSLSALRTAGLITGRGDLEVTSAGLDALGPYQPLPAGRELIQWWKREQLGKAERNVLDVLVSRWPAAVQVDQIAAETGYSATSGGFRNALSRLRSTAACQRPRRTGDQRRPDGGKSPGREVTGRGRTVELP